MDLIWLLAWLGGFGVVGYVAALFLAPAAAAMVAQLALAIVKSPAGMAALALVGGLFAGDVYRGAFDRHACDVRIGAVNATWQRREKTAAEAFRAGRKKRDQEVAAALKSANDRRVADLESAEKDWEARLDAFKQSVAADPACIITPEDVKR